MITIAMHDNNDFIQSVELDGAAYQLKFGWNDQSESWTMDIRTAKNVDIVRGVSVVPNFPLLSQYRRYRKDLPAGELIAVSTQAAESIGREDFLNGKFELMYIPRGEMDVILEARLQD